MRRSDSSIAGSPDGVWRRAVSRTVSFVARLGVATVMAGVSGGPASAAAEPDLLEAEKAFPVVARRVGDHAVELRYTIAAGYYMYRDRFRFTINGQPVLLAKKAWPAGKLKQDATFGKVTTYRNSVHLLLPVSAAAAQAAAAATGREPLTISATSQGCADAGVCYPPLRQTLVLLTGSSEWVNPQESVESGFSRPSASGLADRLTNGK